MANKNTIKTILLSLTVMGIVSIVTLVVLGVLTYILKWQASEAMAGIIFAYIISGLVGGMMQGILNRRAAFNLKNSLEVRGRVAGGLLLGTGYMFILLILSIVFTQNMDWDITRLIVLWILLVCSSVLGSFLSLTFYKKS